MKEAKKTLIRVIELIWGLAAVVVLVGVVIWFVRTFAILPYILGMILGSTVSSLLMLHRYTTLDIELDLEKESAQNHLKMMATLRSILALVALFVSFKFPGLFFPFTTFLGLFATKVAAILYPLIFREKAVTSEEREEHEFPAEQ